jgi:hypothetical protein
LSSTAEGIVCSAITRAVAAEGHFANEGALQAAVAEMLAATGVCERECPATFADAPLRPPQPPATVGLPIDVCAEQPLLDLLLKLPEGSLAIELKYSQLQRWRGTFRCVDVSTKWSSDAVPYAFLKDVHRMERLVRVQSRSGPVNPKYRVCAFLSSNPVDFEGRTPHERMRLIPRRLQRDHRVQYNLVKPNGEPTSANTLWTSYPPFRLAGAYDLAWADLKNDVSEFNAHAAEKRSYPTYRLLVVGVEHCVLPGASIA